MKKIILFLLFFASAILCFNDIAYAKTNIVEIEDNLLTILTIKDYEKANITQSYYKYSLDGLYKEKEDCVEVFNNTDEKYLSNKDIYLMAQIVYAESRSEPFQGQLAVAAVILNRLEHPGFPNTIEGVIKQKGAFSCLKNGKINVKPDKTSYRAVMEALSGKDPTNNAVFYYNPKISTNKWMKNIKKEDIKVIGNHVFFVTK